MLKGQWSRELDVLQDKWRGTKSCFRSLAALVATPRGPPVARKPAVVCSSFGKPSNMSD
jgi:hypothetical protein